jgi:hypothetical protein
VKKVKAARLKAHPVFATFDEDVRETIAATVTA